MVRPGRQVEDREEAGDGESPAGLRTRQTEPSQFYVDLVRKDLGALWEWLPEGAMYHAPNAYLKSEMAMQIAS